MSSWYSNILTNTSSRLNNLQRQVFASEADGDTEDDTHVCRVLRSYYSETGRGLPAWLPPDPKGPPPVVQQQGGNPGGVGSRYGAGAPPNNRWDSSSSLRSGGGAGGRGGAGAGAAAAAGGSRNPFARSNAVTPDPSSAVGAGAGAGGLAAQQARPLTGQRTGSSQTAGSEVSVGGGGGGGVSSAQDRLRQRLWGSGARTTSPNSGTGPFAPPPQQQAQHSGGGYARGGSVSGASAGGGGGGGGGGGDYDPYGPGGQYDSRHGGVPPRRGLPGNPRMR
ncbi:hypothetical protein VPNG_05768 [Cytospora leucostoma]|uniref:Mso1 N-terminal domain-containing protein n=1 Tax=Cytospora leucostoma TaxID=1230097 RepID=A0A423X0B7_9PEZI|nr:hypothetical protein VPNG_05768 [Cytospora leucostoma]